MDLVEHVKNMAKNSLNNHSDGDYMDEEGFLVCGECGTRKQGDVPVPKSFHESGFMRVGVPCECRKVELDAQKEKDRHEKFENEMDRLRRDGITDPAYLNLSFEQDDLQNPVISKVCKKYVEDWEEMLKNNIGVLFYGSVGTGKSFLACCIANSLLEKLVSVSVTNFPTILNKLQGNFSEDRLEFINRLQKYSLLVIDDLGVERDSSYSVEQVYNVIDTRARSGKPLIVTTNLSLEDLQNPPSLAYKRIYDRVLELCPIRLELTGKSRRADNAKRRRDLAKEIMGANGKE